MSRAFAVNQLTLNHFSLSQAFITGFK